MSDDEAPRYRIDGTERVVPANAAAQTHARQLRERDRTEPPPFDWLIGRPLDEASNTTRNRDE